MTTNKEIYRGKRVFKGGKWHDGDQEKVAPELLRPDIRVLPGETLTKDIAEDDKIHELDPPHIRDALSYEHLKEIVQAETPKPPSLTAQLGAAAVALGERAPLRQDRIDGVISRVIKSLLGAMLDNIKHGGDVDLDQVYHLWFPTDNVQQYELREGRQPSDSSRPKHLHGFRLDLDPFCPPDRVMDWFEAAGTPVRDFRAAMNEAKDRAASPIGLPDA